MSVISLLCVASKQVIVRFQLYAYILDIRSGLWLDEQSFCDWASGANTCIQIRNLLCADILPH